MNHTETQNKNIQAWLEQGNSITGMTALEKFGCWSLPRRILDLKEQGVVIDSQFIKLENGKRIKEYWIAQ
jgi:hypothetical protein